MGDGTPDESALNLKLKLSDKVIKSYTVENSCLSELCADLRWISVDHHEAKILRTGTGEIDVEGVTSGHDAVEERHSLLAGVSCTPAMILRAWMYNTQQN